MDLRIPPHSIEAEQAVLGAIFHNNDAFDIACELLSESDFYLNAHRAVWSAFVALIGSGKVADAVTVLARIPGPERDGIPAIAENLGTSRNVRRYAEIVKERSVLRQLMAASMQIDDLANNPAGRSSTELLNAAQEVLAALADKSERGEPQSIQFALSAVIEDVERRHNGAGGIEGLSTGLKDLDAITNGLQNGDLIVIAGRPAMGKTAIAMQIAQNAAMRGEPTLVFSLEMAAKQLAERAISNVGRVSNKVLRSGRLNTHEWESLSAALGRLAPAPLIIDDSCSLNPVLMRSKARKVARKHGLKLIVVDYIGLMDGEGEKRYEIVTEITRKLKGLAREMNVPLIALAQLNRKVEDRSTKRPLMSDLRDSGSVEQDADLVLLMYRDEYYNEDTDQKGVAEIIVGKQRMGETGTVRVSFQGEFSRFDDLAYEWKPSATPKRRQRGMSDD
jgi:replicative DNA helicase